MRDEKEGIRKRKRKRKRKTDLPQLLRNSRFSGANLCKGRDARKPNSVTDGVIVRQTVISTTLDVDGCEVQARGFGAEQ